MDPLLLPVILSEKSNGTPLFQNLNFFVSSGSSVEKSSTLIQPVVPPHFTNNSIVPSQLAVGVVPVNCSQLPEISEDPLAKIISSENPIAWFLFNSKYGCIPL